ncbi:PfaD family polyunsaturated fatty acid/polyketide biosynthesis protein [Flammeovirga sp. EKP202]|uniref:PfaD family polyunsaturated fatty acid/polyketide biosynthesis protein n=1 Tax=Flammeovirga sp. EKP202 TaxID=2770592 RepID=UPI00165FE59B|nr:PfaD family polyunsaturated fatty acid/polyketide biosynthesis protein [Flammeovirga sp. EKP202]MBD0405293.1 PfaD family polyunsaturated fatty acid/polyketide biosynthesis protein [Flammeovirga sp. EKP202]
MDTLTIKNNGLKSAAISTSKWFGASSFAKYTTEEIKQQFEKLDKQLFVIRNQEGTVGVADGMGTASSSDLQSAELLANIPAYAPEALGDPSFRAAYGLKYNYMGGAMANGISSEDLVIALGKAGMLCSFGAGGLIPSRIEQAIDKIQAALPNGPYAFNLIHSPNEVALEREACELFLKRGVKVIEASAFMDLTPFVVKFRAAGLKKNADGSIHMENKIIAKVSRLEVAEKFMRPAPKSILDKLVAEGQITAEQATLALSVPMADDITVEADSGGHTDNRPLVSLLPSVLLLRNRIQEELNYPEQVRVGAAGGISTPQSVLAAFAMGAAFVVTGSINQACLESGASDHSRKVLAQAGMTDIMMAPASDMFELGVKLQVLKKGTLFALRAQKLYDTYIAYDGIDAIPAKERATLEKTVFQDTLENIWKMCIEFFQERDPEQITRSENNPKRKMALIFRWYLGLSSSWANRGVKGRELDYQIWCGPAMGAFNEWVKGTPLENWENRKAVDVAHALFNGAAYLYRLQYLEMHGVQIDGKFKAASVKY